MRATLRSAVSEPQTHVLALEHDAAIRDLISAHLQVNLVVLDVRAQDEDAMQVARRLHAGEVYDRSIDIQILRLRRKIEVDPARPKFITTERGAGYVFASAVEILR
jgi:DNA-binding response OmpR family regulator